jgi:excisionase family DNA binding protein
MKTASVVRTIQEGLVTAARSGSRRCSSQYPRTSRMTLAERLRSKNKALTVEELADLLGVALRTVYKEVEDNRIPFFRIRSSIRFDPH